MQYTDQPDYYVTFQHFNDLLQSVNWNGSTNVKNNVQFIIPLTLGWWQYLSINLAIVH